MNGHCQDMLFHLKRNHQHFEGKHPPEAFHPLKSVQSNGDPASIHRYTICQVFRQLLLSGLSGFYAQKHPVKLNSHSRIAPETLWLFQTIFPIGSRYLFRGFNTLLNFRRPAFDLKMISKHSLYAVFQGHAAKPSLPRQVAHHRVQRWRSTVVPRTWLNSEKREVAKGTRET